MESLWCRVRHLQSGVDAEKMHRLTLLGNGGVGCSGGVRTEGIVGPLTQGVTSWAGAGPIKGHRKGQTRAGYTDKSSVIKAFWTGSEILPQSVGMWLIYGEDAW